MLIDNLQAWRIRLKQGEGGEEAANDPALLGQVLQLSSSPVVLLLLDRGPAGGGVS